MNGTHIYRKFVPSYHASFLTIVKLTGDWSVAMSASVFVVVASCLAALAHGYANPGSCLGACNVHDPALIRRESDGKYFRFSTGNKISYASSSSIEGPWTVLGSVLPSGSSIDLLSRNSPFDTPAFPAYTASLLDCLLRHPSGLRSDLNCVGT